MEITNSGISSNSLFHFTSKQYNLESILRNGFYLRYSLEDFSSITNLVGKSTIALPMVCFCDIPLSQIKYHTQNYGCYAIGLSKEWAVSRKICPIIYTFKNALTAELLNSFSNDYNSMLFEDKIYIDEKETEKKYLDSYVDKYLNTAKSIQAFAKFFKPYEGSTWHEGKWNEQKIIFYNEREWRYLPPVSFFEENNLKGEYSEEIFSIKSKRRAMNLTIQKLFKLKFDPKDIKYIIVKKENEIPEMAEKVRSIFKDTATHSDLQLLFTKIFSLDQIISDL